MSLSSFLRFFHMGTWIPEPAVCAQMYESSCCEKHVFEGVCMKRERETGTYTGDQSERPSSWDRWLQVGHEEKGGCSYRPLGRKLNHIGAHLALIYP